MVGGDRQPGERVGADPPDDRRVDEDVQRLDGQRAERRDRQPDDPPIELVAQDRHRPSLAVGARTARPAADVQVLSRVERRRRNRSG